MYSFVFSISGDPCYVSVDRRLGPAVKLDRLAWSHGRLRLAALAVELAATHVRRHWTGLAALDRSLVELLIGSNAAPHVPAAGLIGRSVAHAWAAIGHRELATSCSGLLALIGGHSVCMRSVYLVLALLRG